MSSSHPRRLFLAFGSLFLVFGIAASFAMRGLREMHELLHDVEHHGKSVRGALELASAIRDQYAHQAHTIILGDDTHLHLYDDADTRVRQLVAEGMKRVGTDEERAWVAEIEGARGELDETFRRGILPAVLRRDQALVLREHARAQELVSLIQDRVDALTARSEAAIGAFETHANFVEHATIRSSLLLFVGALTLALALTVYIGNSIARPMARLRAGVARLEHGDLNTPIGLGTNDEFGRLADQFDRMTLSLKESQAHLVESEKLAGIGRLAAGVAHEINNPLTVILGYARLLRRASHGKTEEDLAVIEVEARRCQNIVEGLLDLARPVHVELADTSLRSVLDEAVARLNDAGKLGGAIVEVTGDGRAHVSAELLRQIIMNLVQNAADAAGPGGRVRAEIEVAEDDATVAVSDSGPGIAAELRARVFEPFFTTKATGTGLGLALSKSLARAQGGDLSLVEATGQGATFLLRLPAKAATR